MEQETEKQNENSELSNLQQNKRFGTWGRPYMMRRKQLNRIFSNINRENNRH